MAEEGWYKCEYCGELYFQPYQTSCFAPHCPKCLDKPEMKLEEIEYDYYFKEIPTPHHPTHFEVLASIKGEGYCRAKFPILFDDYYMAKRFCEVMNGEK